MNRIVLSRSFLSETNSYQELPGRDDYIIPAEYYDRYRLIFSHFHLDRKLVRIGRNGYQKKAERKITDSSKSAVSISESWNSVSLSREVSNLQELVSISSKDAFSQHLLN